MPTADQITSHVLLYVLLVAGIDLGLAWLWRGAREGSSDLDGSRD